ncbi:sensor histidine kinase [Kitasatospora purpeofusca]|uniref:sensor histidine kinase n=1 Tax=Kitasatospora purpeofusca TaxID=67352 RepID=UPI0035DBE586
MPRILAPLLSATTYARWLHLVIGLVFVGVVLMVYPGVEGWSRGELLARAVPVDAALLGLAALVPAMRRAEGVQARLLLVPDREQDIAVEPSRGWADRRRTAAWLVGRVALGGLVGGASVLVPAAAFDLVARPEQAVFGLRPGGEDGSGGPGWAPLLAPVLLFALGWLVVWAGRLQLAMAVRLLGPSPAERLAAAELRAERLLERNLLARELHDSIGHALTVTVLQAGAAREVGDPAFAAKALEVIEETGRRAMDDLERTLALLRDPRDQGDPGDQGESGAPGGSGPGGEDARERPGIDRLPALFETARAAGSPVEARVDVPSGALPGVLSREGYRIVQEGVTNALKYAPGEAISVRITVRDGSLELRCANALRPHTARPHAARPNTARPHGGAPARSGGSPRRGGKGLRGIRERAVLLGGEATAGAESGEWVLTVRVPLRLGG